jgi:hypothetical protein
MSFIRPRLGQQIPADLQEQSPPKPPGPPPEPALVPRGPPRRPRPTLSAELPLPEEPSPPTNLRGREVEQ